jgi:outer membrane lipoprotein SlyB
MDQNKPIIGDPVGAPRKAPHPIFFIAAAGVAAVALIAGAQMLQSKDAASAQNVTPPTAVPATTAATTTSSNAPATAAAPAHAAQAAAPCATCGVVVAVRETRRAGEGTGVGAVAGGVVGGVVGNQFGAGHGKEALTIAGAVGGALAGNQIEKQARATAAWHVDVRISDGTTRTFDYASAPSFAPGEKVEIKGGILVARG